MITQKSSLPGQIRAHSRLAVCLAFVLAAVLGLFLVDGCGIGVDEATERRTLDVNIRAYAELLHGEESPEALAISEHRISEWRDRDYGQAKFYPVWPVMHTLEQQGNARSMENVYHYYMYLVFLLGLFALYSIVRRLTGSRAFGMIGAGLLFVNPRFFAESFYNNKDLMLISMCLIVFWQGLRFLQENDWLSCVGFGLAGAVATNSRILGLAAFGLVGIAYLVVRIARGWTKRDFWRGFAAVLSLLVFFVAMTPACWGGFFEYWKYLIVGTANFDAARWNGWFLYRGAVYNPVENPIPWHYIPWLMIITTPLLILALAALWPVLLVLRNRGEKRRWLAADTVFCLALAVFCIAPLCYAMAARPNLYNSWRHLYFIYIPVVIFAAISLFWLWQSRKKWLRGALAAVLALHFVFYAGFIALNHPHEFAYFNVLAGPHPEERYDADYWNIAQYTVMNEMLARDPAFSAVGRGGTGISWNWYMIRETMPERFGERNEEVTFDRRHRAKYILENTSAWHTELLHPSMDPADPAVQEWIAVTDTLEPVMQVKCGRTVLWNVYENPLYQG